MKKKSYLLLKNSERERKGNVCMGDSDHGMYSIFLVTAEKNFLEGRRVLTYFLYSICFYICEK